MSGVLCDSWGFVCLVCCVTAGVCVSGVLCDSWGFVCLVCCVTAGGLCVWCVV